jgi:small-conductance mechanosensitive channel
MPRQRPSRTTPEALQALRERLQATQEAAQQLADDASSPKPPPAGWDVPRSAERANDEIDQLIAVVASVRDLLPPELRAQLAEIVKQILVFVRAVLDWWIDRVEQEAAPRGGRDDVEDIPIA